MNLNLNVNQKVSVDQGREVYNNLVQKCFDDNDFSIYSTQNEGKSIVAETNIRTLQETIYKKWQLILVNFYLGYLNKLVDEYNNTYHCSFGSSLYWFLLWLKKLTEILKIKTKISNRVRINKYKNIFSKGYTEKANLWTHSIKDSNGERIKESF